MAREPVEKIIDGEKYRFMLMSPTVSLNTLTSLGNVFGSSISKLFASFDKKENEKINVDTAILGDAIAVLCSKLHENNVAEIIKVYTREVINLSDGGKKGVGQITDQVFEEHFRGRLLHLCKVFLACIEVQYADFLAVFGGKIGFLRHLGTVWAKQTSEGGNGLSGDQ